MKKIKVAIIGSGATRGCFELNTEKKYHEIFDSKIFFYRISLVMNKMNEEKKNEVLLELMEYNPDILIFDFVGEIQFGINKIEKVNNESITSYHLKFKKIISEIMEEIYIKKTNLIIVLHSSKFIDYYIDNQGIIKKKNRYDIISNNQKLEKIEEIFKSCIIDKNNFLKIDCSNILIKGQEKHPWGTGFVNYDAEYYNNFMMKLTAQLVFRHLNK